MAHMYHDKSYYSTYWKFDSPQKAHIADHRFIEAVSVGDIKIQTHHDGHSKSSLIKGVLHLPELHTSLLSTAKLADAGVSVCSAPEYTDLINLHTRKFNSWTVLFDLVTFSN